jgi:broad specificity phosphatase PhoE
VTSSEPKAIETGRIIADALNIPMETTDGLEEHDRSNVPMMPSREFISFVELFFRESDRLVLGRETADAAAARFSGAIQDVLTRHPTGNIAIVTHGTVLALFAAEHADSDPFQFWRRMGLPSFVVFAVPEMNVIRTVEKVT